MQLYFQMLTVTMMMMMMTRSLSAAGPDETVFPDADDDYTEGVLVIPDDSFTAPPYRPPSIINFVHWFPRFGTTRDISMLSEKMQDMQRDYLHGVVFMSVIIFVIMLVWLIVLVVLKFMGSSRVGCASGVVPRMPSLSVIAAYNGATATSPRKKMAKEKPSEEKEEQFQKEELFPDIGANNTAQNTSVDTDEPRPIPVFSKPIYKHSSEDVMQWQLESIWTLREMRRLRITYIFCGGVAVAAAIILIVFGILGLNRVYLSTQQELLEFEGKFSNSVRLIGENIETSMKAENNRITLLDRLNNGWCPSVANNFTVDTPDIKPMFQESQDGTLLIPFRALERALTDSLSNLESMNIDGTLTLEEALIEAELKAIDTNAEVKSFTWWFPFSMAATLIHAFFMILSIVAVLFAWRERFAFGIVRVQPWILPVFISFTIVASFMCCGFAIVTILNADVCSGSPQKNLITLYGNYEDKNGLLFDMAKYYVEGCTRNDGMKMNKQPTAFMYNFVPFLREAINASDTLLAEVGQVKDSVVTSACGMDIAPTLNQIALVNSELQRVLGKTNMVISSMYCSVYTPTYLEIMHQGVCYNGVEALFATFITLFIITFCSMVMISVRVSWRRIKDAEDIQIDNRNDQLPGVESS